MPANFYPLLNSLPLDIFCIIISNLDLDSAVSLSRVNKGLNSFFREKSIYRTIVKMSQIRIDSDVILTNNSKNLCEIFEED
jgi:hypothetical protein